jgi:hypothetical protein
MDGQDEFDFQEWHDDGNEQAENLERVSSRIGLAVLNFCRDRKQFLHGGTARLHYPRNRGRGPR